MAVYTNDLRLKEIATGDESGTWGTSTNTNLSLVAEAFSFGTEAITTNADTHTTTIADGSTDPGRSLFLKYTGTLDSACTITIGPNTVSKLWLIENATSGSQNIIIKQGSGATVTVPNGQTKAIYSDGAGSGGAMVDAFAHLNVVDLTVEDDLTVTDDLSVGGTLGVTGVVTANAGVVVDNITIDGTEIDLSSGDLTIDVAGDIILDADSDGSVRFKDGGTEFAHHFLSSNTYFIQAPVSDGDVTIRGNDGGSNVDALTLDMSDAGKAIFNAGASFSHDVTIDADDRALRIGAGQDLALFHDATDSTMRSSTGDFIMSNTAQDKDILFKGNDASSTITALTLDMSAAGAATFNSNVVVGGVLQLPDVAQSIDFIQSGAINFDSNADQTSRVLTIGSNRAGGASGGITNVTFDETGGTVFNEGGVDADFRVESDSNANALLVDAGLSHVGINRAASSVVALTVNSTATNSSTFAFEASNSSGESRLVVRSDGKSDFFDGNNANTFSIGIAGGETVANDGSTDRDFRVESDSNANMLFVNAGSNRVGIGTNAPEEQFSVQDGSGGIIFLGRTSGSTTGLLGRIEMGNTDVDSAMGGIDFTQDGATNNSRIGFLTQTSGSAAQEAARIDSSQNLLVGCTDYPDDTVNNAIGFGVASTGETIAATNNSRAAVFKRMTSDGSIVEFFKDSNLVGSIGNNTDFFIASADGTGLRFTNTQVLPCSESGATQNGSRDLGSSSAKFQDLYLSGGLPGTASGELVINDNSVDSDFRVESDSNTHALFLDATSGGLMVGTSTPLAANTPPGVRYGPGHQAGTLSSNVNVSANTATNVIDMADAMVSDSSGPGMYLITIVRHSNSFGTHFVGIFGANNASQCILYNTLQASNITVSVSGSSIAMSSPTADTYNTNVIPLSIDGG